MQEGTDRRQDRSTNPRRKPSHWWSHHLAIIVGGAIVVKPGDALADPVGRVGVQVVADVRVALHEARGGRVVEPVVNNR